MNRDETMEGFLSMVKHRPSMLSDEEIDKLIEQGAKSARELHKQLECLSRLTAQQRNLVSG